MCRIAGILTRSKTEENRNHLQRMLNVMARGGPDDEGTYFNAEVSFGHRRLAIIDLSPAGHQPMISEEDDLVISFNGEIFNYKEIRQDLAREGATFKTATDTEVIMKAFRKWGTASFAKFLGMYGFSLHDRRNQKVYLVRDPVGIKPMYYSASGDQVIFASQVKAFKAFNANWPAYEPWKVVFLAFGFLPHPFTTLKDVVPLGAGCYLEVNLQDFSSREVRYIDLFEKSGQLRREDAVEFIRGRMKEALIRHLISDAPLGVFLSGGIDSSLLTMLAGEAQSDKLHTISVNFREAAFDESHFQKLVLDRTKHHSHESYLVDESAMWSHTDDIFDAMDQPSIDGVNSYFVSQCANRSGVKAVLSGLGADELFGGYASARRAKWLGSLRRMPARKLMAAAAGSVREAYRRLLFLDIPGPAGDYLFLRGIHTPDHIASMTGVKTSDVWDTLGSIKVKAPEHLDEHGYAAFLEFNFYMSGQLLKDTDYMSMWFGLEARVPFLDMELIKAAHSIGAEVLYNSTQPKYVLTKAFEDLLPAEIIHRKKQGFTFPFDLWLRKKLESEPLFINNGVRSPAQVDKFLKGSAHWSKPWSAVVLARFKWG